MAILRASQITPKERLYYLASRTRRASVNSFFLSLLLDRAVQNGKDYAWLKTSNSKFDDYKRVSGLDANTYCKQHIEDKQYEKLLRDFITIIQADPDNDYVRNMRNTIDEYCTGDSANAVYDCINFGVGTFANRENTFDEEAIEKIANRLNFAPLLKTLTENKNGALVLKNQDDIREDDYRKELEVIVKDLETLPVIFKNYAEKTRSK